MEQNYIEKNQLKSSIILDEGASTHPLHSREVVSTTFNIFLNQNVGKGPPGQKARSDLAIAHHPGHTKGLAHHIAINSLNVPKDIYKLQLINYLIKNKSNHSLIFKFFKS